MRDAKKLPDMLTSKELAKLLRLSPRWGYQTVERMARDGKLPGMKIGDLWRFPKEETLACLAKGAS